MKTTVIFLILRILVAIVLVQSLFLKFTGAEASVPFFSQFSKALKGDASLEGVLRIGLGVVELVSVTLLLMKKPAAISVGALMAAVIMVCVIMAQVSLIGIDSTGGLTLLIIEGLALVVSLTVLFRFRGSLPVLGKFT